MTTPNESYMTIQDTDGTMVVNGAEYDIVHGFFVAVNKNKNIATSFTGMLFKISHQTGIPALDLLKEIKGKGKLEMNKILAYYVNNLKSRSTLYGVTTTPTSNKNITRNIIL